MRRFFLKSCFFITCTIASWISFELIQKGGIDKSFIRKSQDNPDTQNGNEGKIFKDSKHEYFKLRGFGGDISLLNLNIPNNSQFEISNDKENKRKVNIKASTKSLNIRLRNQSFKANETLSRFAHEQESRHRFMRQTENRKIRDAFHYVRSSNYNGDSKYKQKTLVVLLAYLRSGSSFAGDIIQQDPAVFYVYEPFYSTERAIKDGTGEVRLANGKTIDLGNDSFEIRSSDIIDSYLRCNFSNIDVFSMLNNFMESGLKTKQFLQCYKSHLKKLSTMDAYMWCMHKLEDACRNSDVIALKTIRLKAEFLAKLIVKYNNIKIVHLIRDPRSQIFSIDKFGNTANFNGIFAKEKCTRMSEDYNITEKIRKTHPDKYLRIFYEDLAESPQEVSSVIYKFLNLNYSNIVKKHIQNITRSSQEDSPFCETCVNRKNSSDHVMAWRRGFSFEDVRLIDKNCRETYKQYNYFVVKSKEDLKDFSFPVYTRRKYKSKYNY